MTSAPAGLIDLHLHTTASDGRLTVRELVDRAKAAGVAIMAVTDHDTTAAVGEARDYAASVGIESISGIEVTAIDAGSDVHILGYFYDPAHQGLATFLAMQRAARVARVEAIAAKLDSLGMPIDVSTLLADAARQRGRSIGRPQVARAMLDAGHVADIREAFDKWLGGGLPAFVRREGASSEAVIAAIHDAGGIASLAHPKRRVPDERIAMLRDSGLDAVEAYHSDHDAAQIAHYLELAASLGLLVTGGSDFHGDPSHGREVGSAGLPVAEWPRLNEAGRRHARG